MVLAANYIELTNYLFQTRGSEGRECAFGGGRGVGSVSNGGSGRLVSLTFLTRGRSWDCTRSIALALAGSACVCVCCWYGKKVLHTECVCACVCVSFVGTAKRCYTHCVCVCACVCVCVLCWYGKKVLHTECVCVCACVCARTRVYAYMCACLSAVNHTVGSVNKLRTSFGLKSAWTLVLGVSPPFLPLAITPRQPMYG